MSEQFDAVVVGSGPNGLAAAIELAQNGLSVLVLEAKETIGGGARTAEFTLPGFRHDVCSAIHPTAKASPFFRTLPLDKYGLEFIEPPHQIAHPLDDGPAAIVDRSIDSPRHASAMTGRPTASSSSRCPSPRRRSSTTSCAR